MTIEIERGRDPAVARYKFDFNTHTYARGWAQIDNTQDAPYYGLWCNPTTRELFSLCEGDTTLTRCTTDQEFVQEMRECSDFHKGSGRWLGIDPGTGETERTMRARFTELGLADLLH